MSEVAQDRFPRFLLNAVDFHVCVAITTYNRPPLLSRAIQSVVSQQWPDLEILVVDDASTDSTPELIRNCFPHVRYFRQEQNRGPSAARNRALQEAAKPWVIFLDDDDTLAPHAITRIAEHMTEYGSARLYPVLQFARSNGHTDQAFLVATMADYVMERIRGDFVPVVNRRYFLSEGLAYPESCRVGGEALMWWRIADKYGIPSWADVVAEMHADAPMRMTSTEFQVLHARDFAELQERTLAEFGEELETQYPRFYCKKRLGAATYRLLAGEPIQARRHIHLLLRQHICIQSLGLWVLSLTPRAVLRKCYALYRRREVQSRT